MENNSTTVLDLFCGAGGFSTGFKQAGFDILAGIDNNNDALATFYGNHDAGAYNIDLRSNTPEEVLTKIGIEPEGVDVVIGGPPCQGHSGQGKQDPDDPRNLLMADFLHLIDYIQPRAFVMENVKEFADTADGAFLRAVLARVDDMGYTVDYDVLHADDYGVAQTRKRFFLVGVRNGEPSLPTPIPGPKREVWQDLNGLLIRDDLPNNDWRTRKSAHGKSTVENYFEAPAGTDPYPDSNQQVRLPLDCPGRTIIAENLHFHPHQPRYLTVREAATIQSFPLEYRFFGNLTEQRRQVGNAVPPLLAEHIARAVWDALDTRVDLTGQTDHGFVVGDD